MVSKSLVIFSALLVSCYPANPFGTSPDLPNRLVMNTVMYPGKSSIKVWLSSVYECTEYGDSDCNEGESFDFIHSVQDAEIIAYQGEQSWSALENNLNNPYQYWSQYIINPLPTGVKSGQSWEIIASHKDFPTVRATTVIPDTVLFLSSNPNTVTEDQDSIIIRWEQVSTARGYKPEFNLVVIWNDSGSIIQIIEEIGSGFTKIGDGAAMISHIPTAAQVNAAYPTKTVSDQVKFYISPRIQEDPAFLSSVISAYLLLTVYSLNDAMYFTNVLNEKTPDEGDGFNVPRQAFTNIENGFGIFAAYSTSVSEKIVIPAELLQSWFE